MGGTPLPLCRVASTNQLDRDRRLYRRRATRRPARRLSGSTTDRGRRARTRVGDVGAAISTRSVDNEQPTFFRAGVALRSLRVQPPTARHAD